MQSLLNLFLRPFKLLLFLHIHGGSGANPPGGGEKAKPKPSLPVPTKPSTPLTTTENNSDSDTTTISVATNVTSSMVTEAITTTSATQLTLPLIVPPSGTATKRSPTESDPRVAWLYLLRKQELQTEMGKFQLDTEGTLDQLRARFVSFLRMGNSNRPSPTPRPPGEATDSAHFAYEEKESASFRSNNEFGDQERLSSSAHSKPRTLEEISIREMLGLQPTATFREVQEKLFSFQRTRSTDPVMPVASETSQPPLRDHSSYGNPSEKGFLPQPCIPTKILEDMHPMPASANPTYVTSATSFSRYPQGFIYGNVDTHVPSEHRPRGFYQPPQNDIPDNRAQHDVAHICSLVRKWNLRFDGDKDPVSFIERLQELSESYDVNSDLLLKALPELFIGEAIFWFRNNKTGWTTFNEFLDSFKEQYLPPDYLRKLDDEIIRRTQGEREAVKKYVVALTTLMRRRGTFSKDQMLNRLYSNLRPEYKLTIRRELFQSVSELIRLAEGYESYLRERQQYRPPPNPAQSLVPETAYSSKPCSARNVQINALRETKDWASERDLSSFHIQEAKPTSKPPRSYEQVTKNRLTYIDKPGYNDYGNVEHPQHKLQKNGKPTTPTCWNCEKLGHRYRDCRLPKKLKCFNCKKEGIRTVECPCRLGNEIRGRNRGGIPNLDSQTTPPKSGVIGSTK